jgi:hypothetical protein
VPFHRAYLHTLAVEGSLHVEESLHSRCYKATEAKEWSEMKIPFWGRQREGHVLSPAPLADRHKVHSVGEVAAGAPIPHPIPQPVG